MDVARDYTEKWHHTQQIFEAVGTPSTITGSRLFHPCLDTFLRALPFTYRNVQAEDGTSVVVSIYGEAGGDWFLLLNPDVWLSEDSLAPLWLAGAATASPAGGIRPGLEERAEALREL